MNKLVLALATVAAFSLSTTAFAENPAASAAPASTQTQAAQSQPPAAHKVRASHRTGAKKVVRHHTLHRRVAHARHYGHDRGKKVAVKHMPAKRTVTTKTAS
jgi:hypothetical protein